MEESDPTGLSEQGQISTASSWFQFTCCAVCPLAHICLTGYKTDTMEGVSYIRTSRFAQTAIRKPHSSRQDITKSVACSTVIGDASSFAPPNTHMAKHSMIAVPATAAAMMTSRWRSAVARNRRCIPWPLSSG